MLVSSTLISSPNFDRCGKLNAINLPFGDSCIFGYHIGPNPGSPIFSFSLQWEDVQDGAAVQSTPFDRLWCMFEAGQNSDFLGPKGNSTLFT